MNNYAENTSGTTKEQNISNTAGGERREYTITGEKSSDDAKLGVSLNTDADGNVYVTKIQHPNVFDNLLKVGMIITEVNGMDCSEKSNSEVADILREAKAGVITI